MYRLVDPKVAGIVGHGYTEKEALDIRREWFIWYGYHLIMEKM